MAPAPERHEPWECLCVEGWPLDRDPHEPMNPWPQLETLNKGTSVGPTIVHKVNFGFVVRCGGCGMVRP